MSNRKALDLDVLGESHLPDDLFTNTDGKTWMLDSFPEVKGLGVLDHEVMQSPKLPPNLPDGIVVSDEITLGNDQLIFGSLVDLDEVGRSAGLVDLSWLELTEQDLARLPDNPVDDGIRELEDAWGVDRRTDGLRRTHHVDRQAAAYEASLHAGIVQEDKSKEVLAAVRQASRKVASGVPFRDAAVEAARKLGHAASQAREGMRRVQDDAGLIGRVFIRAADYPDCTSGRWTEPVRKHASSAAYVVKKSACGGCVFAKAGSCEVFKKRLVASVSWDDALRHYSPHLEATGRAVDASLSPKEGLRQALAAAPAQLSCVGDVRPVDRLPVDQVSLEDARTAFDAAPSAKIVHADVPRVEVLRVVNGWRAAGHVTQADVERLLASTAPGRDVLRTAARLVAAVKEGSYSGGLNAGKMGYAVTREDAWKALSAAEDRARQASEFLREEQARREHAASQEGRRVAAVERKVAGVKKQIDIGLCGKALVGHVLRTFDASERGLAASILDPYIAEKDALREPDRRAGAYTGLANDVRVAGVDAGEAWARLRAAHVLAPLDLAERQRQQQHQKVLGTLGRWVRDGLLAKADAERLSRSAANPRDVLRAATAIVGRSRVAAYSGVVNDVRVVEVSREAAWAMLAEAEAQAKRASAAVTAEAARRKHVASREGRREALLRTKVAKVTEAVGRGLRGSPLVSFIRKVVAKDELAEMVPLLDPVLRAAGVFDEAGSPPREYEGARYERAQAQARSSSGPAYGEVERLVRWARQRMSEGSAGRELSQLLAGRFTASVRTASADVLRSLRAEHEGLAGHVYVDAEAYATRVGTAGCEKGALRHRANQVPAVLEMSRCASCSLRVARADGAPVCSTYNKVLVKSAAEVVSDPTAHRADMIRLSDGTDADRIASLFSNTYDAGEFRLGEEAELDHLVIADAPSNEDMGDIVFGGLEVE